MPKLNCTVSNCYYNKERKCCLDKINVDGTEAVIEDGTSCGSFKEKLEAATSKVCQCESEPYDKLSVDCEAKNCTYNDNCTCHAEKIGIEGKGAKASCQTSCGSFQCGCM